VSKDLNKVMIIGRLGAEPELRFTGQGTSVTTFRVASGRSWRDADGATQTATEWFRVVAWNSLAEVCNAYLHTGSRVYVEGRLQSRTWSGDDGQEHATTEVIAQEVILLDHRTEGASDAEATTAPEPSAPAAAAPSRRAAIGRTPRRRPVSLEATDLPL
jgi:single-strand DNA-binding protein